MLSFRRRGHRPISEVDSSLYNLFMISVVVQISCLKTTDQSITENLNPIIWNS